MKNETEGLVAPLSQKFLDAVLDGDMTSSQQAEWLLIDNETRESEVARHIRRNTCGFIQDEQGHKQYAQLFLLPVITNFFDGGSELRRPQTSVMRRFEGANMIAATFGAEASGFGTVRILPRLIPCEEALGWMVDDLEGLFHGLAFGMDGVLPECHPQTPTDFPDLSFIAGVLISDKQTGLDVLPTARVQEILPLSLAMQATNEPGVAVSLAVLPKILPPMDYQTALVEGTKAVLGEIVGTLRTQFTLIEVSCVKANGLFDIIVASSGEALCIIRTTIMRIGESKCDEIARFAETGNLQKISQKATRNSVPM